MSKTSFVARTLLFWGLAAIVALPLPLSRAAVPEAGTKKPSPKKQKEPREKEGPSDPKAAQEQLRKVVERVIGPRESPFYVVAISETSFHTGRTRAVLIGNERRTDFEYPGQGSYVPVEKTEFHIQEGRQPCIDFVVERMSAYMEAQAQARQNPVEGQRPPPTGTWKLLGRFKTAEKAEAAVTKAQTIYDTEPHWQADEHEKQ